MPSINRLAVRLFRKKPVQASIQTSLGASGAVPDSGFVFVHNLQGASAALDEFSDGSEGGPFKAQLRLLEDATADYLNSTTDTCCELTDWNCDKTTAELTIAAFKCAAAVYKADPKVADGSDSHPILSGLTGIHRKPETDGIRFNELEYVYPSLDGSSKAIGFWTTESEVIDPTDPHFAALVVAVRGTERIVDHIVNANSRPIAAADFLSFHKHQVLAGFADKLSAHSGFLNSAKALSSLVLRHISRLNQEGRIKHVIFTGHSAGGGVAALLYLKFLLEIDPLYENLKFSCFTFGAPPILGADITEIIKKEPSLERNRGLNLAFVNEFDMVCRVDHSYLRSLIDLYRSVYGLNPVMKDEIARKEEKPGVSIMEDTQYVLPPLDFQNTDQEAAVNPTENGLWPLPKAEYHIFGDLVLLRKEHNTCVKPNERPSKELRALSIRAQDFEKVLYCGIRTHSRTYYGDRMESVIQGKFNYKDGWDRSRGGNA
ncbi:hypothetical protein JMJ35_007447 [Cladonia borealis]|uniref:Fungal lipase-type domain-containing protein n=1 Tax=Cladonia borealis TaxID=184061 RepID=A0AA39QYI3_9LECA|nr:hypothetical protein JMJ35_007447 [Cladonia borealis]